MKLSIYIVLFALLLSSCLKDDQLNQEFKSIEPKDIGDGWGLSCPTAENIDSGALVNIYQDVHNDENLWSIRSLLVIRNGKLVSEAYFKNDMDITTRHLIWSCTKQVVGMLVGIAIDEGLINSIDDPISDYLTTELKGHQDKAGISLEELITMQSGFGYNNDGAGGETDKLLRQIPDNSVEFVLNVPLKDEPGTVFYYNDGAPHILSAIIQKTTGKPTDVWANEVLFSKIGVSNYNWDRYKDEVTLGGFGIITTPRELAKIAQCVANNGQWNGIQIISPEWIEQMTSPVVYNTGGDYAFGYNWWIDPSRNIHFMWGHGGQFAFIIPDKDLVIVITSIPNTQGDYQIQADEVLPYVDKIIDAAF